MAEESIDERPLDALDRSSHTPMYVQIKREMLRRIARWDRESDRFYSDEELSKEFRVSRMTVRQALKELVDEGYLTRARGLGTFLTEKVRERPLEHIAERMDFGGEPVSIQILDLSEIACTASLSKLFRKEEGIPLVQIVRLRTTGTTPISLDHRWILKAHARGLTPDLMEKHSLVEFVSMRSKVTEAEMQFEAAVAPKADAKLLGIPEGTPVLVRHISYTTARNEPVLVGHSMYRSDIARYAVRLPMRESPSSRSE